LGVDISKKKTTGRRGERRSQNTKISSGFPLHSLSTRKESTNSPDGYLRTESNRKKKEKEVGKVRHERTESGQLLDLMRPTKGIEPLHGALEESKRGRKRRNDGTVPTRGSRKGGSKGGAVSIATNREPRNQVPEVIVNSQVKKNTSASQVTGPTGRNQETNQKTFQPGE